MVMTSIGGRLAVFNRANMLLVVIGWIYVVGLWAVAEASAPNGTLLGALVTFVGWGVLPLAIVVYVMATPARRRARQLAEQASARGDADRGDHAAAHAVAAKREEP